MEHQIWITTFGPPDMDHQVFGSPDMDDQVYGLPDVDHQIHSTSPIQPYSFKLTQTHSDSPKLIKDGVRTMLG